MTQMRKRRRPFGSLPSDFDPGGMWTGPTFGKQEWLTWEQAHEIAAEAMRRWDALPVTMRAHYQKIWDRPNAAQT